MERSLGPQPYQYRLPFFGEVVSDNQVRIPGYTQAVVDREIGYARESGLDYWAFLLYEQGSAMSQGLSLYLSSSRKHELDFCAIAGANLFGNAEQFPGRARRLVELMAEPSYQKVRGNRPLLYVFRATEDWLRAWGGAESARRLFEAFRAEVREAGLGEPYLVAMNDTPAQAKEVADAIGAEALTAYAIPGGGGKGGSPYAQLAAAARSFWEQCADTGAQVIPLAMAGWDRRPRVEHPVPWERSWQEPGVGLDRYYQEPTPQELAGHLSDAMQWVSEERELCPAQAVLVYAWNEHDEGGWLCPTLGPDGSANTERVEAIGAMVRTFSPRPPVSPHRPTEGLVLWLDASDAESVVTAEGLVVRWADKSGQGNDALAVDSRMRVVDCPGGRTVIRFLAGDGQFRIPSLKAAGAASVFAVSRRVPGQQTGKYGRVLSYYDGQTKHETGPADWVAPSWCLPVMDEHPYEARLHATIAPEINGLYVGKNMSRGDCFYGDLCEILIYDRALEAPEDRALKSLLRRKWRLGQPWETPTAP